MPTVAGNVRETFDLPLLQEAATGAKAGVSGSRSTTNANTKPVGDALALFEDNPKASRRTSAAEARSQARRCPTCGGVVPVGMSICSTCGLDLETGTRVALDDDMVPPPPPPPSVPLPISIIGAISLLGSAIFAIAALSLWIRGYDGYQYFVPLCLFGVFAAVQFLRRKSTKLLLIALTFGLAIDIVALIAMPVVDANTDNGPVQRTTPVDEPDKADVIIPSVVERLDTQKLSLGIGLIFVYAAVSVYLLSPQVRRHFR